MASSPVWENSTEQSVLLSVRAVREFRPAGAPVLGGPALGGPVLGTELFRSGNRPVLGTELFRSTVGTGLSHQLAWKSLILAKDQDLPPGKFRRNPLRHVWWLCLVCWLALATKGVPLLAQPSDSFEGDSPRWRLVESDCNASVTEHEISQLMPRSGRGCELLEITCTSGERALMAYPIEPTAVLNEFQPSLWVRSAAGNIRLGVRVVFPNAIHPETKNRLAVIVWGDHYQQTGNWQHLQVARIADQLQQETIAIRRLYDQPPDLEHPMIDCLVLNVYTGPGRYRVQIDELVLTGMIPLASVGVPLAANWREQWQWNEKVDLQSASSKFPVWLQHRGEEPAWVGSLGFNGLWLSELPSPAQLSLIAEARLSALSPPPTHGVEFDQRHLTALQGWIIGVALNREQLDLARKNATLAEKLPESMRRPLVGEALEKYWMFSRMLSQTIVPAPDPASAGDLKSKQAWLASMVQSVRMRNDGWVSISAGPSPSIIEQCRAADERLHDNQSNQEELSSEFTSVANPLGFRHELAGAVMAGATGILVRTYSPMPDPISLPSAGDRAMQAAIRWSNNDLKLWSPWLVWGQVMPPPEVSSADFAVRRWRVRDADLIIVQCVNPNAQLCLPPTRSRPLVISMSEVSDVPQAVRLTENSMQLMTMRTAAGIQEWQIDRPAPLEVFLLTRNPQVLAYVRQRLESKAAENAADQLEIASYCAEQASQLLDARFALPETATSQESQRAHIEQHRRLTVIQNRLESGWRSLQARQPQSATAGAFEIFDLSQQIMHEAFLAATANLNSPQSSPFVLTPATLKYHWSVAQACARSQWQAVNIPGGQFTDLAEMLQSGWSQQRRLQDLANLRVELVPSSADNPQSLRLAAFSRASEGYGIGSSSRPIPGGYEGASLRVRSSGFPVSKGQFVRITAQAFIRQVGSDPASGVLFYDNQSGPSIGQLVRGEAGQRVPVELYRFATADGEFRILAECRGECDIQIENLTASIIEPATNRRSFVSTPLEVE